MRFIVIALLAASSVAAAGPLEVRIDTPPAVAEAGDAFAVRVRFVNTTKSTLRIGIDCGWGQQWEVSDAELSVQTLASAKCIADRTDPIAPERQLIFTLNVGSLAGAQLGSHVFRMRFTPRGAATTDWSNPVAIRISRRTRP